MLDKKKKGTTLENYLRALNISKKTKQVKVIVVSLAVICSSSIVILYTQSVPQMMIKADNKMFANRPRVKMGSEIFLGGFLITSGSTGSNPRL